MDGHLEWINQQYHLRRPQFEQECGGHIDLKRSYDFKKRLATEWHSMSEEERMPARHDAKMKQMMLTKPIDEERAEDRPSARNADLWKIPCSQDFPVAPQVLEDKCRQCFDVNDDEVTPPVADWCSAMREKFDGNLFVRDSGSQLQKHPPALV